MVITLEESLMDMVPAGEGFQAVPGGSPYNMSLAMARLGGRVAFLGRFSEDDLGRQLFDHLAESGVEMQWAEPTSLPTTLSFATIQEDGGASYSIALDQTAACALTTADVADFSARPAAIHLTSFALFIEPVASAIDALLDSVGEQVVISVDPNIRPFLVDDRASVCCRLDEVMARADLIKCSDEDLAWMQPGMSAEEFAREWIARGAALVIVTCGAQGALLMGRAGEVRVSAPRIEVSDTIGAGDTFQAGLLTWLQREERLTREGLQELSLKDLTAMGEFAAAAAAVTCSRAGCNPPSLAELE